MKHFLLNEILLATYLAQPNTAYEMKEDIFEQIDDFQIPPEQHIEETHLTHNDDMSDKEVFEINSVSEGDSKHGIYYCIPVCA